MKEEEEVVHFRDRIVMLDVKIGYHSEMYDDSLARIEPLLPDFDDEEKVLHITDPFFAFYLRWGNLNG